MNDVSFEWISTHGIRLHVAQAGPPDGPLVLLLHGFPEFWYGWRKQIDALAAAGYRVWAPDQRGYNLSDKPQAVRDYTLDKLTADAVGLIDAAGCEQAHVVGHDWGGVVGWWIAANDPERVTRLAIMNVPHPHVMRKLLSTSARQLARSWYVFAFQLPWLPEWAARRSEWKGVFKSMQKSSRPGTFTDEDYDRYREAWSQPGAITGMLNWYRAALRYGTGRPKHSRIQVPTLLLWGAQDKFIGREAAPASMNLCDRGELVFYEQASHWLQHEEAEDVNRRLLTFFG